MLILKLGHPSFQILVVLKRPVHVIQLINQFFLCVKWLEKELKLILIKNFSVFITFSRNPLKLSNVFEIKHTSSCVSNGKYINFSISTLSSFLSKSDESFNFYKDLRISQFYLPLFSNLINLINSKIMTNLTGWTSIPCAISRNTLTHCFE